MDVAAREIIQIVDSVLFTPMDELVEAIPVCLQRCRREFMLSFVEVHLSGRRWIERIKVIGHDSGIEGTNPIWSPSNC